MLLTVPADFSLVTLDRLCKFNATGAGGTVFEVYGSLPVSGFAAGRSAPSLPQPTRSQFEAYVRSALSHNIPFNYTLNGSCLGGAEYDTQWRSHLREFVEYLSSLGISSFTVSTPALVAIVHHLLPDASITVSLTADIRTSSVVREYLALGATKVMASVSLYRRFQQLEQLVRTAGVEVGVLLNSFCYPDCTYRREHFNTSGHPQANIPDLYTSLGSFDFNRCALAKLTDPKLFLHTAWIRPEDVEYYEALGVGFFKLEGRQRNGFDAPLAAAVYAQRTYNGNLCALHALFAECSLSRLIHIENRELQGFLDRFRRGYPCDTRNCDVCGHCSRYAQRAIRILDHDALTAAAKRVRGELMEFIHSGSVMT